MFQLIRCDVNISQIKGLPWWQNREGATRKNVHWDEWKWEWDIFLNTIRTAQTNGKYFAGFPWLRVPKISWTKKSSASRSRAGWILFLHFDARCEMKADRWRNEKSFRIALSFYFAGSCFSSVEFLCMRERGERKKKQSCAGEQTSEDSFRFTFHLQLTLISHRSPSFASFISLQSRQPLNALAIPPLRRILINHWALK